MEIRPLCALMRPFKKKVAKRKRRPHFPYSKACLTYSEKLVSYLARYTRKGGMSESRFVSANEQSVSFKYRDYADNNRDKVMTLSCDEFLRRY